MNQLDMHDEQLSDVVKTLLLFSDRKVHVGVLPGDGKAVLVVFIEASHEEVDDAARRVDEALESDDPVLEAAFSLEGSV